MNEFRVWAPRAQSVEMILAPGPNLAAPGGLVQALPLTATACGWWSVGNPLPGKETDYAYTVDGAGPFPDPRSPWQPFGVHGPSRTLDHSAFLWTDRRWRPTLLAEAILYELHIGTFTPQGTFDAAIGKLDHLLRLGVTHVELMPVAEFPGTRGWGYDGVDLFAPHHSYGGPANLKLLVDTCHARGIAVLLDVVYNHLGPDGNYLSRFGPYFTDRYRTPWGQAVNLDGPGSREVRRFFCDNALMWLRDYHFDGLRLDATHAIHDSSAIHFLEQLASEVRDLESETGRHFELIAENDLNDPRLVTSTRAGGYGFDAQWNDDFHHALHTVLTGEHSGYYSDFGNIADLAKSLKSVYVYDGRESGFRQRVQGRPVRGLSAHRFIGFLQNHDQVGNRAAGDRLSGLLNTHRLRIGAALTLCAPFIPMLFQGEEFGTTTPFLYFTDHSDAGVAAAVSNGRRQEFASFGWTPEEIPEPQAWSTFGSSRLDWNQPEHQPHEELFRWYRTVVSLRRTIPDLRDGSLSEADVEFSESEAWLVLYRGSIVVVCNFSDRPRSIALRFPALPLLASEMDFSVNENVAGLPGEAVLILERQEVSE